MAIDKIVFVATGNGLTSVFHSPGDRQVTFEWGPQAMFLAPRHTGHITESMSRLGADVAGAVEVLASADAA